MIRSSTPRVGIVYGGNYWQNQPFEELDIIESYELIDLYTLSKQYSWLGKLNLNIYDIVIVPWAPDQITLKASDNEIKKFLERGGVLLAFGEFDQNWIPQTSWRFDLFNDVSFSQSNSVLYSNLSEDELSNWHDSAHGWFTGIPGHAEVMFETKLPNGEVVPVGFIDRNSFSGSILAMTIDADFHAYNGIESSKLLLMNCVSWAIAEFHRINDGKGHNFRRQLLYLNYYAGVVIDRYIEILVGIFASLIVYMVF
jgi:hypothetical protein